MEKTIAKYDKDYKNYVLEKVDEFNSNGKRTIVHFCDTYYPIIDGVIKVLENYALSLCKTFNVVLIVPKHKGLSVVDKTDYLVIGTKGLFLKFVNYDIATPFGDKFLKKVFKKLRVDLVHAHSPFTLGKLGSKFAKKKGVPFIMTLHSQYKQDFMRYTKSKVLTSFLLSRIMKVFNKSQEVWTMHKLTQNVIRDYGYKGKVHLVPNATDFYTEDIELSIDELKEIVNKKHCLSPDIPVFSFVGRIMAQKNIHFIVDALKILSDNGLNFKMFFIGNGPDEKSLIKHIESCELEDKIVLTGRLDSKTDLASYYARSDLFLFPSVYDTSSLVQIEASALYTPSVLLEGTATAQTVTHGVNGYISPNSVEDFAKVVLDALSNKEQLSLISTKAHDDLYVTWKDLSRRITKRYNKLIEENKKTIENNQSN